MDDLLISANQLWIHPTAATKHKQCFIVGSLQRMDEEGVNEWLVNMNSVVNISNEDTCKAATCQVLRHVGQVAWDRQAEGRVAATLEGVWVAMERGKRFSCLDWNWKYRVREVIVMKVKIKGNIAGKKDKMKDRWEYWALWRAFSLLDFIHLFIILIVYLLWVF